MKEQKVTVKVPYKLVIIKNGKKMEYDIKYHKTLYKKEDKDTQLSILLKYLYSDAMLFSVVNRKEKLSNLVDTYLHNFGLLDEDIANNQQYVANHQQSKIFVDETDMVDETEMRRGSYFVYIYVYTKEETFSLYEEVLNERKGQDAFTFSALINKNGHVMYIERDSYFASHKFESIDTKEQFLEYAEKAKNYIEQNRKRAEAIINEIKCKNVTCDIVYPMEDTIELGYHRQDNSKFSSSYAYLSVLSTIENAKEVANLMQQLYDKCTEISVIEN